jgi:hypothetical protein
MVPKSTLLLFFFYKGKILLDEKPQSTSSTYQYNTNSLGKSKGNTNTATQHTKNAAKHQNYRTTKQTKSNTETTPNST